MRAALLIAVWIAVSTSGLVGLVSYESKAGAEGDAPDLWPADSSLALDPALPTLVMAVHPRCACSRASIAELAQLVSRTSGAVAIRVLFLHPSDVPEDWSRTDLWASAQRIEGAVLHQDVEGLEAIRFGAETSGHVVIYDKSGRRLFSGGITGARGHEGDNLGLERALQSVRANDRTPGSSVFGCALANRNDPRRNVQ